ncbi:hypothetical protein PILCRDRAFT_5108 [Piloderma croceum F 1598]|uniref:Uncharacterized protein n=1 Tax=Piloderma croceum (strain F 1598) TaxID=765440 RepID=A0A0C3FPF2_PILCF|nr:hypothetical protein PILCRDRAFT_5108 [Piloderma croceum F 1598]
MASGDPDNSFAVAPIPPPSHGFLNAQLSATSSLRGVASAAMAFDPASFSNQASGSIAGILNQNRKFSSMLQDAFTLSAISSALRFQAAPTSVGPQAASVPQVDNVRAVLKIRAQLGRLAGGGAKIPNFLQQIHLDALADKD